MILKGILYLGIVICLYGLYQQAGFLWHFFDYPENPVRGENLQGMFLVGLLWGVAWVGVIVLANIYRTQLSKTERIIANLSGGLVGAGLVLSVVLDFAI